MRLMQIIPVVLAFSVAAAGSVSGGVAATTASPPAPSISTYQAVAALQMTVSNKSGYANLREKPSSSSKLLAVLQQGTKVAAIEKVSGGKWTRVKVNSMEGYIVTKALK